MSVLDRYSPKSTGIRDPRDPKKKNGIIHNPPRYLYFGGVPGAPMQAGDKGPKFRPGDGQNAVGPISDRGRGGPRR